MPRGQFALQWPWRWLQETRTVPQSYQVADSVQPVVDVGHEWPPQIQFFQQLFTVDASASSALALPAPATGNTRKWILLEISVLNGATVTQMRLFRESLAAAQQLSLAAYIGAPVSGFPFYAIGGIFTADQAFTATRPYQGAGPQYIVDGEAIQLRFNVVNGLTATTATVSGLFLEAPKNQPLLYS